VYANVSINRKSYAVQISIDMPLLSAISSIVGLTDTKFECRVSQCGACAEFINGKLTKSCSILIADATEKEIFTMKGNLEILRQTLSNGKMSQSRDCQSRQLIAATSLLDAIEKPTNKNIDAAIGCNILQM
jgi:aerobic-type carbon monoxide dehydrogenase small subunit (CoxS/CutS family)